MSDHRPYLIQVIGAGDREPLNGDLSDLSTEAARLLRSDAQNLVNALSEILADREDEWYGAIVSALEHSDEAPMDAVASFEEWQRLRSALGRWMDDTNEDMVRAAVTAEYDADEER